jgi:hypothetical protein
MNLALSRDRFFERRKLLAGLDSLNRSVDVTGQVGALDEIQQQAAEVLLGGGFDGGRVIGQSDRMGGVPVTDTFKPRHLISTILRSVIDPGQLRLLPNVPMEVTKLSRSPTHHRFGLNQGEPQAKARRREKVREEHRMSPLLWLTRTRD